MILARDLKDRVVLSAEQQETFVIQNTGFLFGLHVSQISVFAFHWSLKKFFFFFYEFTHLIWDTESLLLKHKYFGGSWSKATMWRWCCGVVAVQINFRSTTHLIPQHVLPSLNLWCRVTTDCI